MLEVIQGMKREKPNSVSLYCDAAIRAILKLNENPNDKQAKLRVIFYGIKAINAGDDVEKNKQLRTFESAEGDFYGIEYIKDLMKSLTPNEIMQMFPVDKVYNGERFGIKD